jgi:hypothetical protein
MLHRARGTEDEPAGTFREVFGLAEFRALWLAQLASVTGDQLARVAVTVLVYERTRSALLAAVSFAASVVPMFIGGVALGGLADRLPRRQVMIGADLTAGALVAVMAIPGMPLAALIMLLAAVTMTGAVFLAARSAIYPDILHGNRYVLGTAVTMTTALFAQVAGFSAGGIAVGFLGVRTCLLADAATFGASALIIRIRVRARPVASAGRDTPPGPSRQSAPAATTPRRGRHAKPSPAAEVMGGLRLVFGDPAMRTPMLYGWLCAFYELPQGLAAPLATGMGGGAMTVGLILGVQALGSAAGVIGFSRLVDRARQVKFTGPLAVAACATLAFFAVGPSPAATLLILALSGLFGCYQSAANASFVRAAPPARRSQAFGVAYGGINLVQGTAMILAGATAQRFTPAAVISAAGMTGALCALALMFSGSARQVHGHQDAQGARRRSAAVLSEVPDVVDRLAARPDTACHRSRRSAGAGRLAVPRPRTGELDPWPVPRLRRSPAPVPLPGPVGAVDHRGDATGRPAPDVFILIHPRLPLAFLLLLAPGPGSRHREPGGARARYAVRAGCCGSADLTCGVVAGTAGYQARPLGCRAVAGSIWPGGVSGCAGQRRSAARDIEARDGYGAGHRAGGRPGTGTDAASTRGPARHRR